MPEIKHTFQAGKMNKDLDERLVPNGEYRDALNIEIRTSDGSDVGSAQTVTGNEKRMTSIDPTKDIESTVNWLGQKSEVVGSIVNDKTNKCYFFIASPPVNPYETSHIVESKVYKDTIVEYDTITRKINPVFNDVFEVHTTNELLCADFSTEDAKGIVIGDGIQAQIEDDADGNPQFAYNQVVDYIRVSEDVVKYLKPNMTAQAFTSEGSPILTGGEAGINGPIPVIKSIRGDKVYLDRECDEVLDLTVVSTWVFRASNVLGFYKNSYTKSKIITGINIIDDFLFWTDNSSEPKKVNIKRSKQGTSDFWLHTKLMVSQPNSLTNELVEVGNIDEDTDSYVKEEHITVIRKSPRTAPRLIMSESTRDNTSGICINPFLNSNNETGTSANGDIIPNANIQGATFFVGDQITLTASATGLEDSEVRATILEVNNDGTYEIEVLNVPTQLSTSESTQYTVELIQDKPLFELKFGRFGYRYKYQDGEYSSFSPWSRLAFLPGEFDYVPIKGYNLGMVNHLRSLTITDFIVENDQRPDDVVEVDILYKDTVSPNVYVVKSIRRGVDPEWDKYGQSGTQGSLNITSEMIHLTLPNNQTLRAWDNVPRVAKAQEVTGNRVVYANYVQNYDVKQPLSIIQTIHTEDHQDPAPMPWKPPVPDYYGKESVKSIRKYKIGVVFGDKYGRETPVLGMGGATASTEDADSLSINADVTNPKTNAHKVNKLVAQQNWSNPIGDYTPSSWMEYYKYYIKETTNEYYNLAMDRWYDAEDGNVWLSFQSSDRNKVDIETYLILKNKHGSNDPVSEEARYKILAIENNAPNYVKTTQKILGSAQIKENDGNDLDNIASSQIVTLNQTDWESTFDGVEVEGIAYARVRGIHNGIAKYSKWVKVSRLNHTSYTITTIQPFGDEADMYSIFNQSDGTGVTIDVELKEDVIENRPEFDGRFFVKIYRDALLRDSVLSQSGASMNYSTVKSFAYAYLSDHGNHPSQAGTYNSSNYSWQSAHGFNSGNVSAEFATCGWATESKAFWNDWGSTSWAGTKWFLHETRSLWKNWGSKHRKGLYSYNSSIEGLDAMHFSVSGNGHPPFPTDGIDGEFRGTMQSAGTFFKFRDDPNDTIYVTVGTTSSAASKNYHRNSQGCKDCKDSWGGCGTRTMLVLFTQKDFPTKGVITSEWDPRSELKHDGRSKGYIDIVEPFYSNSSKEVFSDGNAIWETEPKEDVGLDLYYEASSALPVKLKESNNESFAPINSLVTCIRPSGVLDDEGNTIPNAIVELGDTPLDEDGAPSGPPNKVYLASIVRDIVGLKEENSGDFAFTTNPAKIGDRLKFTWPNGTVTESTIVDHYDELSSVSNYHEHIHKYRKANASPNTDSEGIEVMVRAVDHNPQFPGETIMHATDTPVDGTPSLTQLLENGHWYISGYTIIFSDSYNQLVQNSFVPAMMNADVTFAGVSNYYGQFGEMNSSGNVGDPEYFIRVNKTWGDGWQSWLDLGYAGAVSIKLLFSPITAYYKIDSDVYKYRTQLPWYNCYSFGNGLESDRIRDDFNANTIDNGAKVSSTLRSYGEEHRSSGLIYSGIYNSTSGVNELNEFNMANPITKDLNPSYGSIQALKTRDTNLVTFCEDKVFQILANKDALYNADGSSNVTASNAVLGDAKAFAGDFGISSNPESLAVDGFRIYFTDKQRNKVLRLSQDGLTPISDVGMISYFRNNLKPTKELLGSFDDVKGEYNLSLKHQADYPRLSKVVVNDAATSVVSWVTNEYDDVTVSFNEKTKGWSSFKSFVPQQALSINDEYLTAVDGNIWSHHSNVKTDSNGNIVASDVDENNFYGQPYYSTINVLFNDNPGSVKGFTSINYEGTQAKVNQLTDGTALDALGNSIDITDNRFDNLTSKEGWWVTSFSTDLQDGRVDEFINKEGKWFNNILGVATEYSNLDLEEFSVQGIGVAVVDANYDTKFVLTLKPNG